MRPTTVRRARLADVMLDGAVGLVVAGALGLTFWRLHFGVDFTDEAFYVAVPYRLIRGARVFVDTTAVAQGFVALLIYPALRAYYAIRGLTGIVLFTREVQFVFSVVVAGSVVLATRSVVRTRVALLAATAAVLFVPFDIRALSYDTLGCGFFTAGCFLGFRSLSGPEVRAVRIASGICLGLSVFTYPPLVVAVSACLAIRLVLSRPEARRAAVTWEIPSLALPLVAMASIILTAGVRQVVADDHARTALTGQGNPHRLAEVAAFEWHNLDRTLALLGGALVLVAAWRGRRRATLALALLLPLLGASEAVSVTSSLEYVGRYGMFAVPLFVLVRARSDARRLMLSVWLPALVAGLVTGFSSSNGGIAFGIGFFPAVVVTTIMLALVVEQEGLRAAPLAVVPATAVVALLVLFQLGPSYRDGSLGALRAPISDGAFAGLTTTASKRAFLTRLTRSLSGVASSCRVLFFDDFPAGYLLSSGAPDTNTTWMNDSEELPATRLALTRYYEQRHRFPQVVVEMKYVPENLLDPRGDPDAGIFETYPPGRSALAAIGPRRYHVVEKTPDYTIFEENSSGCGGVSTLVAGQRSPTRA